MDSDDAQLLNRLESTGIDFSDISKPDEKKKKKMYHTMLARPSSQPTPSITQDPDFPQPKPKPKPKQTSSSQISPNQSDSNKGKPKPKRKKKDPMMMMRRKPMMTMNYALSAKNKLSRDQLKDMMSSLIQLHLKEQEASLPTVDYFRDAPEKSGIQIWHIVVGERKRMAPVPVPVFEMGDFRSTDAYIVLHTTSPTSASSRNFTIIRNIYYWIGSRCPPVNIAVCTFLVMELDLVLGNTASHFREHQYEESQRFKDFFGGTLRYTDPEEEPVSYLSPMERAIPEFTPCLIRVRKIVGGDAAFEASQFDAHSRISVHYVPISKRTFQSRDVYILCEGRDGRSVHLWQGRESPLIVRWKAQALLSQIDAEHRDFYCETGKQRYLDVRVIDQDYEPNDFWDTVNMCQEKAESKLSTEARSTLVMNLTKTDFSLPALYLLRLDSNGKPHIHEMPAPKLQRSLLSSKDAYVIDCHNEEMYVWAGKSCPLLVRKYAVALAGLITDKKKDENPSEYIPQKPKLVHEGLEPFMFREKFDEGYDFMDGNESFRQRMNLIYPLAEFHYTQGYCEFVKGEFPLEHPSAERSFPTIDDGSGALQMWRVGSTSKLNSLDEMLTKEPLCVTLYDADEYIIMYEQDEISGRQLDPWFKGNNGGVFVPRRVAYFWSGARGTMFRQMMLMAWRKRFQEMFRTVVNPPSLVMQEQYKETEHFMRVFQNCLVINLGQADQDQRKVKLYRIYIPSSLRTRAIEMKPSIDSLNPNDAFILWRDDNEQGYIWYGKHANKNTTRKYAQHYAQLLQMNDPLTIYQDEEPEEFWQFVSKQSSKSKSHPVSRREFQVDSDDSDSSDDDESSSSDEEYETDDSSEYESSSSDSDSEYTSSSDESEWDSDSSEEDDNADGSEDEPVEYFGARLLRCSVLSGHFQISIVPNFTREDLNSSEVMLLESDEDIYVWRGSKVSDKLAKIAYKSAEWISVVMRDCIGVVEVDEGKEPLDFKVHFPEWRLTEYTQDLYVQRRRALRLREYNLRQAVTPILELINSSQFKDVLYHRHSEINIENAKYIYSLFVEFKGIKEGSTISDKDFKEFEKLMRNKIHASKELPSKFIDRLWKLFFFLAKTLPSSNQFEPPKLQATIDHSEEEGDPRLAKMRALRERMSSGSIMKQNRMTAELQQFSSITVGRQSKERVTDVMDDVVKKTSLRMMQLEEQNRPLNAKKRDAPLMIPEQVWSVAYGKKKQGSSSSDHASSQEQGGSEGNSKHNVDQLKDISQTHGNLVAHEWIKISQAAMETKKRKKNTAISRDQFEFPSDYRARQRRHQQQQQHQRQEQKSKEKRKDKENKAADILKPPKAPRRHMPGNGESSRRRTTSTKADNSKPTIDEPVVQRRRSTSLTMQTESNNPKRTPPSSSNTNEKNTEKRKDSSSNLSLNFSSLDSTESKQSHKSPHKDNHNENKTDKNESSTNKPTASIPGAYRARSFSRKSTEPPPSILTSARRHYSGGSSSTSSETQQSNSSTSKYPKNSSLARLQAMKQKMNQQQHDSSGTDNDYSSSSSSYYSSSDDDYDDVSE